MTLGLMKGSLQEAATTSTSIESGWRVQKPSLGEGHPSPVLQCYGGGGTISKCHHHHLSTMENKDEARGPSDETPS